jgi:cobalt-zinc-cadmium efflux system protein
VIARATGPAVTGFSAWLFLRGSTTELNVRGAYLHMAADSAVSLGVAAGGVLML